MTKLRELWVTNMHEIPGLALKALCISLWSGGQIALEIKRCALDNKT
jgi:hypothetical protein